MMVNLICPTRTMLIVLVAILWFCSRLEAEEQFDLSMQKEVEHTIRRGCRYLVDSQERDGSWSHYPGITALVVTAFLQGPYMEDQANDPVIDHGIDYLLSCVQADGGIYTEGLPAYNTAVSLMALVARNDDRHAAIIRRARDFLIDLQADEDRGFSPDSTFYGGIGYGNDGQADLSNLQLALEALRASEAYRKSEEFSGHKREYAGDGDPKEIVQKELFWDKAIVFLQRCQNLNTYNDQSWAGDDGGFIYDPSHSKASGTTSYGSMTYAGMRSFIYAGVDRMDPRVQAAFEWVSRHFTVDENPEMGQQGLFYYYHTMAKALNTYGDEVIIDDRGAKHYWRTELADKVVSIQHGDGYWVNAKGRWWESDKNLVTAYALLTLERILDH